MITNTNPQRTIKSDETVIDIIEHLSEHDGATVTEIASALDRSKSTVHGHLSTLEKRGYVCKTDSQYSLGMLFVGLGKRVQQRLPYYDMVTTAIERLAETTGERTQFMVEEHGRGFFISRAEGPNAVQVGPPIGDPRYLHDSACGKAILAALPEEQVDAIVTHFGLPARTQKTITDREQLKANLEQIREKNYSTNLEESRVGLFGIGTAVTSEDEVIGSISISGPINRLDDLREDLLSKLLGTANEIELNLKNY